jgi:hypothetical protein
MKNNLLTHLLRHILLLLLTCSLAAAASQPELQKVRHTVLSPISEQVTLQLNGSYIPKVFTLKGETPRIIFDFPDMIHGREIQGTTTTKGALVKRIRVGMHTGETSKTRVVFDMATLNGVTYTQKFDEKSSSLIIQVTTTAKDAKSKSPSSPEANPSQKKDTVQKADENKGPLAVTTQPPEATAGAQAIVKTEPPQTAISTEPPPEATKETPLPSKSTAEKAEEKVTSAATVAQPQPEATPGPSASTKTTQAESEAKVQTAAKETSTKPLIATEKTEEKTQAPAKATPPPDTTPAAQTLAKTEAVKPAAPPGGGAGPMLESIKFEGTSPKGEMVLFKLSDFHPPVIHGVEEGVPRVICDFNNTQLADAVKNIIKADGKFVKVIRITKLKKPDRIRVVLDLAPNHSYDLQQVFFKEDNLFVIIVNLVKK